MKDFKPLTYAIEVNKEYLNFSAAHFLIFSDGQREPLHGHNYRVHFYGEAPQLNQQDMVFDFLDIKPLIKKICDQLDHRLLLPTENELLKIETHNQQTSIRVGVEEFNIPSADIKLLPLHNISAEALAAYLLTEISTMIQHEFNFHFSFIRLKVEETSGQSAVVEQHF